MKEKIYDIICGTGIKVMSSIFPEYFAKEPLRPTDRYIEYPFVLSKLPRVPAKILDVGCSGSMFPLLMQSLGHTVCGIDIRPYPLKDVFVKQGDICFNDFKSETFDVVTAVSTIEHIGLKGRYGAIDSSSDYEAISQIFRILKTGGTFLMTVPFGKYQETKFHRIYDKITLNTILAGFTWSYKIVQSPEADYQLALIFAIK